MNTFDCDRILRTAGIATLDYHAEIGSTNTRALDLALAGPPAGPLLVLAERQNCGRGRGENQWWAGAGALTFSLLVDRGAADVPQRNWPLVSLSTALAVTQVLERLLPGADTRIKWPNDVFVSGRKICGILVEAAPQRPGTLVIGIGVNVNNSLANAPAPLPAIATSLFDVSGREFDRTAVLLDIVNGVLDQLPQLDQDTWQLAEVWRQRCYLQGRTIQLDTGRRQITGVCHGIDDQGALMILTEGGIEKFFGGVVAKIL